MRVDAHAMEIRLSCVERLDAPSCVPGGQQVQPFIQVGAADAHGRAVCHAGGKSSGAYVGADYFGGDSGQRFRFGHAKQWTVLNGTYGFSLFMMPSMRGVCVDAGVWCVTWVMMTEWGRIGPPLLKSLSSSEGIRFGLFRGTR